MNSNAAKQENLKQKLDIRYLVDSAVINNNEKELREALDLACVFVDKKPDSNVWEEIAFRLYEIDSQNYNLGQKLGRELSSKNLQYDKLKKELDNIYEMGASTELLGDPKIKDLVDSAVKNNNEEELREALELALKANDKGIWKQIAARLYEIDKQHNDWGTELGYKLSSENVKYKQLGVKLSNLLSKFKGRAIGGRRSRKTKNRRRSSRRVRQIKK